MTNLNLSSLSDAQARVTELCQKLRSESAKNQLSLLQEFANLGDLGLEVAMEFLLQRQANQQPHGFEGNLVDGKAYQLLFDADSTQAQTFLQQHFPTGVVPLRSEQGIDYLPLQRLLAQQDFQAADRLTVEYLCQLAGPQAVQRKWLYFTEVDRFPIPDLKTIDQLWLVHSEGKFGFSVQRELWISVGKNWEQLWPRIGWKSDNNWTRYPQEFTWNLTAPRGHLPLSNQLRGVRVIAALLAHPAWSS